MNLLTCLLIGLLSIWFVAAVVWIVRRRGNPCAGCKRGDCTACARGKK